MATVKKNLTCLLTVEEMKTLGVELADFREAQAQHEFKRLFTGTENQMAEYNLESENNMLVVDCEAVFDLFENVSAPGWTDTEVIETRLLETSDNE